MAEMTLIQIAYLQGYCRARQQARAELREMAAHWDQELTQLANNLTEIDIEFRKYREEIEVVERDPDPLLN
jgi:hypothetical protein